MSILMKGSKNLLNLKDRTQVPYDSSAGANTSIRNFNENQYYVGMTGNNYWYYWNFGSATVEENKIYVEPKLSGYGVVFPIKCKPNTKYNMTCINENGFVVVGYYTENGEWLSFNNTIPINNLEFITPDNCYWFTLCFVAKDLTKSATYTYIMVHEGDGVIPYSPCDRTVVKMNIKSNSKNLFNIYKLQSFEPQFTNNGDGSFTMTAYNAVSDKSLGYMAQKLEAGKTYTLSLKTESNSSFIYLNGSNRAWVSGRSLVITQEDLDKTIYVYGYSTTHENNGTPSKTWDIMINEGSTALPYEPYLIKYKVFVKGDLI